MELSYWRVGRAHEKVVHMHKDVCSGPEDLLGIRLVTGNMNEENL